ncbi:hypothetical protein [Gemmatimonas aurantiaca]|uniref:hypothetical protein n=1 Tax=Gemmatimonas aurantiaca TaxID=173480 RepID=UPI00301D8C9D
MRDVVRDQLVVDGLIERAELRQTLGISTQAFPARSRPDLVVQRGDRFHILEVKSSKADDRRSQCVLGKPFRVHLENRGHTGPAPWEVEQDLIKLELFAELSPAVESCMFLMVDAYVGSGPWWSDVFSSVELFRTTMRTQFVKESAARFLANTVVEPIVSADCKARLIMCEVVNRRQSHAV